MIAFINKYVRAAKASLLYSRALDRASESDHAEALAQLNSVYEAFRTEMPSRDVPYDVNILCGHVAAQLGKYDIAVEAITIALEQLQREKIKGLSEHDRKYLKYYCAVEMRYCASKMGPGAVSKELLASAPEFYSLQIGKVKPYIRRNFPIDRPDAFNHAYFSGSN